MIYRQRNRKRNLGLKILISIFVLFLLARIFNVNIMGGVFRNISGYILESQSAIVSPFKNSLVYFVSKKQLQENYRKVLEENTNIKIDMLTNQIVTDEFAQFKNQFGQFATQTYPIKVILRPPFTPFDIVQISGELEPYQQGGLVFYKSVAIGRLAEKTGRYGTVQLFSSPDWITPASIRGTQFEAKGLGGGRYVIEAQKDFAIERGDAITYPNEKIILLGVVQEIEVKEEDVFKRVYFNIPVPIASLDYVTIEKPYEQTQNPQ